MEQLCSFDWTSQQSRASVSLCTRLHGHVAIHAATDIPRLYKNGGRAQIILHDDEIERFCTEAPQPVADGMRLVALTGLRRADLVGPCWNEIEAVKISRVMPKSRRRRKRAIVPMDL